MHSYGTEERRTPVFVPPRDETYDFIIFKASDIKDLIVCEQPKANSPHSAFSPGLPYDPAIVSISKNPPPEPKLPSKLMSGMNMGAGGSAGGPNGGFLRPYDEYIKVPFKITEKPGARRSFDHILGPMRFDYRFPNFQPQPPRAKRSSGTNVIDGLRTVIQSLKILFAISFLSRSATSF